MENENKPARAIRFSPDLNTIAWMSFGDGPGANQPEIVCLVLNESYKGCSLLFVTEHDVHIDDLVRVRVGKLNLMNARIAWLKKWDDSILRAGFEYCE